jgi:MoxR-like ATPase
MRAEIEKIQQMMEKADYVTDPAIATSVHLAMTLKKPLLIEGHAGVGKTEVAKVMARMLDTNLIRLQCYEGLDAAQALYEWNYPKQLLHIKLEEATTHTLREKEATIFSESFLIRRPLLQAISQAGKPPVLLIDEVDRCVTANTLVTTAQGLKRASEIQPGDEVVSFDPAAFRITRSRVKKLVPRETAQVVRLLVGGRFLEVTPEHRFVRFNGEGHEVVRADQLRKGDRLPLHKGSALDLSCDERSGTPGSGNTRRLRSAYRTSGLDERPGATTVETLPGEPVSGTFPYPLLGASADHRAKFLEEFFGGEYQVASDSPYLLVGIQALLSSLGLDSQIALDLARFDILETRCPSYTLSFSDDLELRTLSDLLGRGVVLGEITHVETVEAPQAVYDFVLDGQPYFVANQVITHNCDEEFEAFLLESLAEFQVTIPELGTIKAKHPPYVILTSNRVRELSDALRRRCLYLWIDFPGFEKEVRIVTRKVPGVNEALAREISRFMEGLRTMRLSKVPGVAESLDWAQALASLHANHLDEELVLETLGCVLKDADDIKRFKRELTSSGLKRFVAAEG